jgi:hypothetical protein
VEGTAGFSVRCEVGVEVAGLIEGAREEGFREAVCLFLPVNIFLSYDMIFLESEA